MIDCRNFTPVGFYTPAALTGTTFTFEACDEIDGTYVAVADGEGAAVGRTVAADNFVPLDPTTFCGIHYLKIVSDQSEGAERTIRVVGRQV